MLLPFALRLGENSKLPRRKNASDVSFPLELRRDSYIDRAANESCYCRLLHSSFTMKRG